MITLFRNINYFQSPLSPFWLMTMYCYRFEKYSVHGNYILYGIYDSWHIYRIGVQWVDVSHYFFRDFIYLFLERGREGESEGHKFNVWFPLTRPVLGTWPATQACALTGNRTNNLSVCRSLLNPLSHTSQGIMLF